MMKKHMNELSGSPRHSAVCWLVVVVFVLFFQMTTSSRQ